MGYIQAILEALKIIGCVLNWWKERSDETRKAKKEVLKEVFDAKSQEDIRKLINRFNSIG